MLRPDSGPAFVDEPDSANSRFGVEVFLGCIRLRREGVIEAGMHIPVEGVSGRLECFVDSGRQSAWGESGFDVAFYWAVRIRRRVHSRSFGAKIVCA